MFGPQLSAVVSCSHHLGVPYLLLGLLLANVLLKRVLVLDFDRAVLRDMHVGLAGLVYSDCGGVHFNLFYLSKMCDENTDFHEGMIDEKS